MRDRSFPINRKTSDNTLMSYSNACWVRILAYFKDMLEAERWFSIPNENLRENVTPFYYLQTRRGDQLLDYIKHFTGEKNGRVE